MGGIDLYTKLSTLSTKKEGKITQFYGNRVERTFCIEMMKLKKKKKKYVFWVDFFNVKKLRTICKIVA